jgi:hypothetical protein
MDILLIEGVAERRIRVANHLTNAGHRVTLSSSVLEAEEILEFVPSQAAAPQAVVISETLLKEGGGTPPGHRHPLSKDELDPLAPRSLPVLAGRMASKSCPAISSCSWHEQFRHGEYSGHRG